MKVLKRILVVLLVLIAIAVGVAYLLPAHMKIERSALVNASQEVVFEQVNTLKNWESWSPWHKIDPAMKLVYSELPAGEGAYYEWESNNPKAGAGKLTIKKVFASDSLLVEMEFKGQGNASILFSFKAAENGTNVTWTMISDLGMNPVARYMGLIMKSDVENDFESGLANMNTVCENLPKAPSIVVEEKMIPAQKYIAIYDSCSMQDMPKKMGEMFTLLMEFAKKNKIQPSNAPFALYLRYTETMTYFETGLPVAKDVKGKGNIGMRNMEAADALMTVHTGSYNNLSQTYDKFMKWIAFNKKQVVGTAIEVYVTDPATEADTSKWVTEIYFPIKK